MLQHRCNRIYSQCSNSCEIECNESCSLRNHASSVQQKIANGAHWALCEIQRSIIREAQLWDGDHVDNVHVVSQWTIFASRVYAQWGVWFPFVFDEFCSSSFHSAFAWLRINGCVWCVILTRALFVKLLFPYGSPYSSGSTTKGKSQVKSFMWRTR